MFKSAALFLLLGITVGQAQITINSSIRSFTVSAELDGDIDIDSATDTTTGMFSQFGPAFVLSADADSFAQASGGQNSAFTIAPGAVSFTGAPFLASGIISASDAVGSASTAAESMFDIKFTVTSAATFTTTFTLMGTGTGSYVLTDTTAATNIGFVPGFNSVPLIAGHSYEAFFTINANLSGAADGTVDESASVDFAITAIPEPSTWMLSGVGALLLVVWKSRRFSSEPGE